MLCSLPLNCCWRWYGIRYTEGPYGMVRSSNQGENHKALFETPDCRSLLLQESLSFAIINGFCWMLYSMKQTHCCCQLQAGEIIIVMYDSKAQQCLLPWGLDHCLCLCHLAAHTLLLDDPHPAPCRSVRPFCDKCSGYGFESLRLRNYFLARRKQNQMWLDAWSLSLILNIVNCHLLTAPLIY